ncbi:MAG: ornithine carbamoyltransferase [Acidobacteria bacterium]|nr:MAG: ornithine carbamoyltransferase [Acidobacteriota bacterium]RLE21827.1 MAG: ornithine carbamoyltransferase [Acidobacteriota bacterium]
MKHLIRLDEAKSTDIERILDLAARMEAAPESFQDELAGRTVGLFFQKPSTRMRFAFEVGVAQLGGNTSVFRTSDLQLSRGESLADTARVLSNFLDAILIRGRTQQDLADFVQFGTIPVINGLTAKFYPVGALGAAYTIKKKFGTLAGRKLVYVGDGNNIAHSLMLLCPKTGMDITVISPEWYQPSPDVVEEGERLAKSAGTKFEITDDTGAVEGADIIFTDGWTSMGMEEEREERLQTFRGYQVNRQLLEMAGGKPMVLHCMPVRRGEEISAQVAAESEIYENAANLLHVVKAILYYLL